MLLKLSDFTAARRRWYFFCVDETDGETPEPGLTFSASELQLSKNGAAFANFAGTATELSDGLYYYEATAAELDTVGALAFKVEKAGVRTAVFEVGQVVSFDPYDSTNLGLSSVGEIPGIAFLVGSIFTIVDATSTAVAALPTANQIRDAILNFSHDTGLTIKGFFRRLDALAAGKATGLRGTVARFFMQNDTDVAIEANQDVGQGTRQRADVTDSEA